MNIVATLLAALMLVSSSASYAQETIEDLSRFPERTVTVAGARAAHRFTVWVADTPARQRQGLMFVRDLAADRGMLFVNERARPSSFWMKNTFIPLDILFFDERGKLVTIFANTPPLSLDPVGPDEPIRWILELRGGEAAKRGLRAGDRLTFP